MTAPFLGCIADDFTGATDLANNLVRAGMRVVQTIGIPAAPFTGDADAIVVALKSRTIPAAEAVTQSLAALAWLQAQGTRQTYFKYCSTFDSTAEGNIGPVTEALMDALGTDFTIACPAFPDNGRTVFKGYLFVGDELLHESGMRDHPLTPMTDSSLVRVLQGQSTRRVGLIDHRTVAQGTAAIETRIEALRSEGVSMAIVDATRNEDLLQMGRAFATLPLVTAGSGVAIGLPQNFGLDAVAGASQLPAAQGLRAVVSGSCSTATNAQVADFIARGGAAFAIDPLRMASGHDVAAEALAWADARLAPGKPGKPGNGTLLVYATAAPEAVRAVQAQLGVARAGEIVEDTLARIARGLIERGVGQLIVAGGETSGACVQSLGISTLRIGPQIAPGVPWCHAASPHAGEQGLHIALKSGNFGAADFFSEAFRVLGE